MSKTKSEIIYENEKREILIEYLKKIVDFLDSISRYSINKNYDHVLLGVREFVKERIDEIYRDRINAIYVENAVENMDELYQEEFPKQWDQIHDSYKLFHELMRGKNINQIYKEKIDFVED